MPRHPEPAAEIDFQTRDTERLAEAGIETLAVSRCDTNGHVIAEAVADLLKTKVISRSSCSVASKTSRLRCWTGSVAASRRL